MISRTELFVNDEYYHVYNRGVDKRDVFMDKLDLRRFFQSMEEFNAVEPIGSIYENTFKKDEDLPLGNGKLVEFVAFCLNPNHYHFILRQIAGGGISEFMKRLGGGYTKYFNEKNKRSGALFQGRYKVKHIDNNDYLLHLSAYVNLNSRVHKIELGRPTSKLVKSSWDEYTTDGNETKKDKNFCAKDIILGQFKNKKEYLSFAEDALGIMLARKENEKEISDLMLE